jgi:OFA family oxalate/formate antiporter-like MFS transporter
LLSGHLVFRRVQPAALVLGVGIVAAAGLLIAGVGRSLLIVGFGYSLLFGAANGIGYGYALHIAREARPDRKGLAIGIVTAAYALGVVVFARLFAKLIAYGGAGFTFIAMAAIVFAIGLAGAALLRLAGAVRCDLPSDLAASGDPPQHRRIFTLLWIGYGFGAAAGLMALGHAAGIVAATGGTSDQLVLGAMVIGLGNGVGGFAAGWLADRWPARMLLVVAAVFSASVLALIAMMTDPGAVIGGLALIGLAYGAIIALYPVAVASYYRPDETAKVFGRVFTAWGIAGLGAPWLAGVLFDVSGGYEAALILAAAAALFAAGVTTLLPAPRSRSEVKA